MTDRKTYLGNSVYLTIMDDYVYLTTEINHGVTDIIYLTPDVLANLLRALTTPTKTPAQAPEP